MMRKLFLILLLSGYIYADSTFVGPSAFYTNGTYSNGNSSRAFDFYNLLQVSPRYTLLMHYNNLLIRNSGWNYEQQGVAGGLIADYSPWIVKVNYAHYMGEYRDNATTPDYYYDYSEFNNVYNVDCFFTKDWNYLGASYTYIDGAHSFTNHQITFRFDKFVSPLLFFSVKPAVIIYENETLYSAAIKMFYYPSEHFIIKAGGFAGERTFYFDQDLVLFYNQNDIQRYQVFGQFEYVFSKNIALITNYSHTSFNNFEINYLVAGIRAGFWL